MVLASWRSLILFGLLLGAGVSLSSSAKAGGDETWDFSSGTKIILHDGGTKGASIQKGRAKPVRITAAQVVFGPTSDPNTLSRRYPLPSNEKMATLTTSQQVFVVNEKGKVINLPFDRMRMANSSPDMAMDLVYTKINHGGHAFSAISVTYKTDPTSTNKGTGETYVVRDDGVFVRVNYSGQYWRSDVSQVNDGILELKGVARRIDLDHFEGEARFQAKPPTPVLDTDGKVITDPVVKAKELFRDISEDYRSGRSEAFAGDEKDEAVIRKIRTALGEPETGSAVILGKSGSGKSSLFFIFLSDMIKGKYPELPRTLHALVLDSATLGQGTKWAGAYQSRISLLCAYLREVPALLFIDEMHSLRGSGTNEGNKNDFFELMKSALADGSARAIGTTTRSEYLRAFAGDPALMRRFAQIEKPDPEREKVELALDSWTARFGKPTIPEEQKGHLIDLADEFGANDSLMSRTMKLAARSFSVQEMNGKWSAPLTNAAINEGAMSLYQLEAWTLDPEKARERYEALPAALDENVIGNYSVKHALVDLEGQRLSGTQDRGKPAIRLLIPGPRGSGKTETARQFALVMGRPFVRIEMNKYANGSVDLFRQEMADAVRTNAFSVICLDEFEKAHEIVKQAALAVFDAAEMVASEHSGSAGQTASMVTVDFKNASFIATTNAGQAFLLAQQMAKAGNAISLPSKPARPIGFVPSLKAPLAKGAIGFISQPPRDPSLPPAERQRIGFLGGPVDEMDLTAQTARAEMMDKELLKAALIADGIPDTIMDRFQVIAPSMPPTSAEFAQVVELHLRRALADISQRTGNQVLFENPEALIEFAVRALYRPDMSNRVVHELINQYVRTPVSQKKLVLQDSKGKKLGIRLRYKPGGVELDTFDPCKQSLTPVPQTA